jgi:hypothetical protein
MTNYSGMNKHSNCLLIILGFLFLCGIMSGVLTQWPF